MTEDRHQGTLDAIEQKRREQRATIEQLCDQLRGALEVPAYRIWYCPFSSDELIELGSSSLASEGGPIMVMYASSREQLRGTYQEGLTPMKRTFDGAHPRWDNVVRDLVGSSAQGAPFWEADLCVAEADGRRRVGVVTLFDDAGQGNVPDDLSIETRARAKELIEQLAAEVHAYRQVRYHLETIGTLERSFTEDIINADAQLEATPFFEAVSRWFRRILPDASDGFDDQGQPVVQANTCALFIKDENRLVMVDATPDYKSAASIATDGLLDNFLTRIPLDQNEDSLMAFAYEVMSREHQPLIFPSGRADGAYIASLLEDVRQRLDRLESVDEDEISIPPGGVAEGDPVPVSPRTARNMLRSFYQAVKHRGSIGFFPLMRREEVEGVFVMFPAERTFFNPANVLLTRAISDRLCRLPELLPDHRQDKDYRDRKTRLIYIEQRHQRLDRYLTGGQRVQAVAFLDLDGFRILNDVYGHRVGDKVLDAMMEGLVVAAHRPSMLANRYSALQFVEQEKNKIDAEQYAATELSKKRRRKSLEMLPLHYGGDEFGLVFLGKDEGEDAQIVERCRAVMGDLLGYVRFRLAGHVDAGRLRISTGLALPTQLKDGGEDANNEFALYSALRDLGNTLMYFAKGVEELDLYCPGHTVHEHRFELELDEGGPGVWRAMLISRKGAGDRVPMSGDVLQLDLLNALDRTVGRHIRNTEDREAIIRRIKKTMDPVHFEVLARLPAVGTRGGRGIRDQYLVRQLDRSTDVRISVGDHLFGHVLV